MNPNMNCLIAVLFSLQNPVARSPAMEYRIPAGNAQARVPKVTKPEPDLDSRPPGATTKPPIVCAPWLRVRCSPVVRKISLSLPQNAQNRFSVGTTESRKDRILIFTGQYFPQATVEVVQGGLRQGLEGFGV